jgi:hypothetical protein
MCCGASPWMVAGIFGHGGGVAAGWPREPPSWRIWSSKLQSLRLVRPAVRRLRRRRLERWWLGRLCCWPRSIHLGSVGAWQRQGGGVVALLVADVRLQVVVWQLGWFEVKDPRRNPCPGLWSGLATATPVGAVDFLGSVVQDSSRHHGVLPPEGNLRSLGSDDGGASVSLSLLRALSRSGLRPGDSRMDG